MSQSAFIFDAFVATDKNISFLSGGQQYIADVEKFDEMNPSNTNNGKYNHWNIVNEDGKLLHNLFPVEDFRPRSAVFKVKRGERSNTQRDRIDTRPPISGCPQLNLCQQTNMFFTLDKLADTEGIVSDTRAYAPSSYTVKTDAHPEGVILTQLLLDKSGVHVHEEELRKYPSVKFMYSGYDTVHEALTNRFVPTGDFRTPDYIGIDADMTENVSRGWQYLKNFNGSEHIAIFNDIFNDQEVTLYGDAVSTKTYYDEQYSVPGKEFALLDDGSWADLDKSVTDAALIPSLLNYTVVTVNEKQNWKRAFPDDEICHNIFEFTMNKVKWVDQDMGSQAYVIDNQSTIEKINQVPYEYLTHGGCEEYQIGARCTGGTLKVRMSIPYTNSMTLEQFVAWISTIGTIKLRNYPSIPNVDYRKKRFITLDGSVTWDELPATGAFQVVFNKKCSDEFVRTKQLVPMPKKLSYIGATEKDFTQTVPFESISKLKFKIKGTALGTSDAAISTKAEWISGGEGEEYDNARITLRVRFWLGSYNITTPEACQQFFAEHPLLIKLPCDEDDAKWTEDKSPDTEDNFYPNHKHKYEINAVRDYKQVDVCGPLLYLVYRHSIKTESEHYIPVQLDNVEFVPMTVYGNTKSSWKDDLLIKSEEDLESRMSDEDRNHTNIDVLSNYETVESINSINRLGLGSNTIKSNLFSVSISNLGLGNNAGLSETDKYRIRRWITEKVEDLSKNIAPANTQLFRVFLND